MEAKLASFKPLAAAAAQEHAKTVVLLESCQLAQEGSLSLSRKKLVETIVKSGEPEITLSLQQYTKTVRTYSTLNGLFFGVVLGLVLGVFAAMLFFRLLPSTTPPPVQNHYYNAGMPFPPGNYPLETDMILKHQSPKGDSP